MVDSSASPHRQQLRDALLKVQEVQAAAGMSRSQIYKLAKLGKFPSPVRQGPRFTRWHASAINAWLSDPQGWGEGQSLNPEVLA